MTLDERSKVSLIVGTVCIYNQFLIRLNISSMYMYNDSGFDSFEYILRFSHLNALGIKFDLAVKQVKVNPESLFVHSW